MHLKDVWAKHRVRAHCVGSEGGHPVLWRGKEVSSMKTDPGSFYLQQQRVLLRLAPAHVSRGVPPGSCTQPEVMVLGLGALQTLC